MMVAVPTGFTQSTGRPPIGTTLAVFGCFLGLLLAAYLQHHESLQRLLPYLFIAPKPRPISWLSHLFLPSDTLQLVVSGGMLFISGVIVEGRWTIFGFLAAFVLCGAAAAVATVAFHSPSPVALTGPTGAVAGLLVISFFIAPRMGVEMSYMMLGFFKLRRGVFVVGPLFLLVAWAVFQAAWPTLAEWLRASWPEGMPMLASPLDWAGQCGGAMAGLVLALFSLKGDLFRYFRRQELIPVHVSSEAIVKRQPQLFEQASREHRQALSSVELSLGSDSSPEMKLKQVTMELMSMGNSRTSELLTVQDPNLYTENQLAPDDDDEPDSSSASASLSSVLQTIGSLAIQRKSPKKDAETLGRLESELIAIANLGEWKLFFDRFPAFFSDSERYTGEPYLLLLAANQYGRVKQWEWVRQILQRLWEKHPDCEVTDQLAHHSLASMIFEKRSAKPYIRRIGRCFLEGIQDEHWRKEVAGLLAKVSVWLVFSWIGLVAWEFVAPVWAAAPKPAFRFCVDEVVEDAVTEIVGKKQHAPGEVAVISDTTANWKRRILQGKEHCDLFILEGSDAVRMIRKEGPFKGAVILPVAQTQLSVCQRLDEYNPASNPVRDIKGVEKGRLVTLDPVATPAGVHAEYALKAMGLWKSTEEKLRHVASSRKAILEVKEKRADMAVLYRSATVAEPKLKEILVIPVQMTLPVVYFGVIPDDGNAKRFHAYRWLQELTMKNTADIWTFFRFFPPVEDDTIPQELQE